MRRLATLLPIVALVVAFAGPAPAQTAQSPPSTLQSFVSAALIET